MDRAALTVIDGDARVSCRHLQEVLGFARIDNLHKLIRTHMDELEDFGGIFRFEAEKSGRGCTVKTAAATVQWFADNWPSDLEWPKGIARPAQSKPGRAA